jgi:hypothetical protein
MARIRVLLAFGAVALVPALLPALMSADSAGAAQGALGAARTLPPSFANPVWSVSTGAIGFTSPTVAVIDGVQAAVTASHSGYVYVVNAATGKELPGWPQKVQITPGVGTAVDSTPAVAYLDGPGKPPTIIVGAGSLSVSNQQGGVEAFYANGAKRFVFHTKPSSNVWGTGPSIYDDPVFDTPSVGDVTGNGTDDIVFGSFDKYIYALTPSGHLVSGFPYDNEDTVWSSPALFDASGTGRDDIYIGGDASGYLGCRGGFLYDFRWYDGGLHTVWRHCEPQTFWSSPAIGPITAGGKPAVVIGTSFNQTYYTASDSDLVYAFYASNGATVPGWPVHTSGPTFGSPAIGDILGNGQPSVVATSCAHGSCLPDVSAWTGSGHLLWSRVLSGNETLGSPTLADLTGRGASDVLVGNPTGLYALYGLSGAFLYGTGSKPLQAKCWVEGAPAVTEIPGVGWRLIDTCGGAYQPGRMVAYPLPVVPDAPPAWAQWRSDANHEALEADAPAPGHVNCKVPTAPAGYRFVAGDGGIFSFGNQSFCGSLGATWLAQGVVGMATTPDGGGYWLATADGAVYAFGDAHLYSGGGGLLRYGSVQGLPLGGPIVGIAATANGRGYWLVGADGSVYSFGDAANYGSMGGKPLNKPIVGMAADPRTGGYWLVSEDGGIFSFHAPFYGSTGSIHLNKPIVGMADDTATGGYWFVAADGGIFSFHAPFYGSTGSFHLSKPIVGMAVDAATGGYWLVGGDGGIFSFHAHFYGSTGGIHLHETIVGMAGPGAA